MKNGFDRCRQWCISVEIFGSRKGQDGLLLAVFYVNMRNNMESLQVVSFFSIGPAREN